MTKQHVDISNARYDEQKAVMQKIIDAGHCPFCDSNLALYHTKPIEKEGTHWILTQNQWPYYNSKIHLLAILKTHKEHLYELTPEEGAELIQLFGWAEQQYSMPGGGCALRFGDTKYSAGTVRHLHAQLLVPDIEAPDFAQKPVKIKIGATPE